MYIKGIYKKNIFLSDNGYIVGLIKVIDNDIDASLNNKTITFTGYFTNINLEDNLILNGNFVRHNKYGEQFNTTSYEVTIPDTENGIITFLSSNIFKGIGENKAKKIYDNFGNESLNIILNEPDKLKTIKGITLKNITLLHDKLLEYQDSYNIIVKLNELGFSSQDSTNLYYKYKNKVLDVINENIYKIVTEQKEFNFKRIDSLALHMKYDIYDKRRISSGIIYVFSEVINTIGDTYLYYTEIYNYLNRALNININNDLLENTIEELINNNQIKRVEEKYYLKKMYDAEKSICNRIVYLNNQKDLKVKDLDNYLNNQETDNNIIYNEEQKEAIKNSFLKNFLVITGGPGTGKTTIIKSIVNLYKKINKVSEKDLLNEVTLLAPTGRASKRMMESVNFPASTIHRFLKWNKETNKFGINEFNKVNTKLVIIDEASMIDTYLMDNLLKGLYYDTRIILVGDYNQLPSVGSGELLKDIIESKEFTVIKLNKLYRQEENSNIITLAYDVNGGVIDQSIFNINDDLTYINADSYNLIDKFSELCYTYKDYDYTNFIILAPMYKTINGIDNLNLIAKEIFNPKSINKAEITIGDIVYRESDKVIELVNMPDDNVFNGDIGIIERIDNDKKEIYIDYDGNLVKYTKSNFSNFKLGYVTSIHKSQGSEFKVVIMIILNEFNRMLYRKLLYTGITRAKSNLYILGELDALDKASKNNTSFERKTSLKELINEMYLNKE